jgi:hypothetical protein
MKKIILLAIILNISLNGFSQKIILAENPLEETLQNDFDSSILYSYQNRGHYYNYLIISKKDTLVYFYRYASPLKSSFNFGDKAPYNSNIYSKLVDNQLKFIGTKPDINSYFSWVDTKLANESIWKDISKYKLWNFIDDSKIDSLVNICDEITYDNGFEVFKLLTKDKIIELKYDDPYGKIKNCKFNQTREDIIKIEEIISKFFKSKY